MTDSVKARERGLISETSIEKLLDRALDLFHRYNLSLILVHDRLKEIQPKSNGSICLELYDCGPKCQGCPHPRWVKYMWRPGKEKAFLTSINLSAKKQDPVLSLQKKTPEYAEAVSLIREGKQIIAARAKLLNLFSELNRSVSAGERA